VPFSNECILSLELFQSAELSGDDSLPATKMSSLAPSLSRSVIKVSPIKTLLSVPPANGSTVACAIGVV